MKRFILLLLSVIFILTSCNGATDIAQSVAIDTAITADQTAPDTDDIGVNDVKDDKTDEEKEEEKEEPEPEEVLVGKRILSPMFMSHMVLQRDKEITVFGTGTGTGSVTLGSVTKTFTAVNNSWEVVFDAMPYTAEPVTFEAELGESKQVLVDVVIGDVYLASGQSNMDLKLKDTEQSVSGAYASKLIRFKNRDVYSWKRFTKENTQELSAVATLFAINLEKSLKDEIPIGIISAAVGASRIERWTSAEYANKAPYATLAGVDNSTHDCWEKYITPFVKFEVAGVLWYQGESNRKIEVASSYYQLFENMVACWRDAFGCEDLPFYTVQIMLFSGNKDTDRAEHEIRIAQWKAAMNMKNVTLCTLLSLKDTLTDDGALDIHPPDKQPIADALSNAVLSTYYTPRGEYDKTPEYSGPLCSGVSVSGNVATVSFDHVGDGLMLTGTRTYVREMEIMLSDGKWVTTDKAVIVGNTVVITVEQGETILGVRLGYCNQPTLNLFNSLNGKSNYCVSPFIWTA